MFSPVAESPPATSILRRIRRQLKTYGRMLRHPSWILMFVFGRLMLSRRIWRAYHKLFPTPKILSKSTVFDPAVRDSVLENLRVNGIAGG